jgi:hypothetical protein
MSSILDSTKLIASIRRRAFIPRDQNTFTDDDFLEMASEEITIGLMEQIIEARGDYLVYFVDIPLVEGQNKYDIPYRAHGSKLRAASINDANDIEKVVYDLKQVAIEDIPDLDFNSPFAQTLFYLENNKVVLSSDVISIDYNIRMYFYMRPSKLVQNKRGGTIESITDAVEVVDSENVDVKVLSFTTLPTHFSSALLYDICGSNSPNKIKAWDLTCVSVNNTLKTVSILASEWDDDIVVGDYLTKAEETIVPNLPTVYHPIVAQRTARACLESLNDDAGYAKATAKLNEMEKSVLKIVTNRVEGSPKKIKNRGGTLRSSVNKNARRW